MPDNGKSAIGLDANLAAAIGYPITILAIICLIMDKENKFVKFHAIQSIIYFVGMFVVFVSLGILLAILTMISTVFAAFALIYPLLGLAFLAGLIFAAVKAYGGDQFKLPVIGDMAEKFAAK
jgi:uncharacterized membrane protein